MHAAYLRCPVGIPKAWRDENGPIDLRGFAVLCNYEINPEDRGVTDSQPMGLLQPGDDVIRQALHIYAPMPDDSASTQSHLGVSAVITRKFKVTDEYRDV